MKRRQRKRSKFTESTLRNQLKARVENEAPPSRNSTAQAKQSVPVRTFAELPISQKTSTALEAAGFVHMTAIQKEAIPHALCGRDILGAAKTGSGKSLAFLVPVLEKLYRLNWDSVSGLGALIISPTRELSLQIFEVLRAVGVNHSFSAGLIIGGRSKGDKFAGEKELIISMNIIVCTPGRLLQHLDETPQFSCENLQILVLDEADRITDMGFDREISAIVENLPSNHQTLLFSATQTKSVKRLAKLSLVSPEYISVHEGSSKATPSQLAQQFITVSAHEKFDVLYSFLRTHLKTKCLVFVSTRKQAQYLFEMFRRVKPGISLSCIHGKQGQPKRMSIYYDFLNKSESCMFATDLAARGLDFKGIDWVIQFDCPEDVSSYIHRVGRTARYKSKGSALLFLLPSELKMAELIQNSKIPLRKVLSNPKKVLSISQRFQSFLARDEQLKYLAQRAFSCYMKSVFIRSDKSVFDVHAIDSTALGLAMGLPGVPVIKFGKKKKTETKAKNVPHALKELFSHKTSQSQSSKKRELTAADKLILKKNTTVYDSSRVKIRHRDKNQDDDEFFAVKENHSSSSEDEDGDISPSSSSNGVQQTEAEMNAQGESTKYLRKMNEKLKEQDPNDQIADSTRVKLMHQKKKMKLKQKDREEEENPLEMAVTLLPVGDSSSEDNALSESTESDTEESDSVFSFEEPAGRHGSPQTADNNGVESRKKRKRIRNDEDLEERALSVLKRRVH